MPIQIWNEWRFPAVLNSRTPSQSTTSHVSEPSVSDPIRTAPAAAGLRSVQKAASVLFGRVGFGKFWLLMELSGPLRSADDEVAVARDPDLSPGLTGEREGRDVEIRDRVVADTADRRDTERRQRQIAAGR